MRYIVYHQVEPTNVGTPERPVWLAGKGRLCVMRYSRRNWEIACREAWGDVEIEEDESEELDVEN